MSLKTKKDLFLSQANTNYLVKQFFLNHKNDGGTHPPEVFKEQVPKLMKEWKILEVVDSYESLIDDPITELRMMDKDFINEHASVWGAAGRPVLLRTWDLSAQDYLTLDLPSAPEGIDVSSSMYRRDNKPYLLQQKIHTRHTDFKDSGSRTSYRSLPQPSKGYDMSAIYSVIEKPYKQADELDAPSNPYDWKDGVDGLSWTGF